MHLRRITPRSEPCLLVFVEEHMELKSISVPAMEWGGVWGVRLLAATVSAVGMAPLSLAPLGKCCFVRERVVKTTTSSTRDNLVTLGRGLLDVGGRSDAIRRM
jgi:hypothetical protein